MTNVTWLPWSHQTASAVYVRVAGVAEPQACGQHVKLVIVGWGTGWMIVQLLVQLIEQSAPVWQLGTHVEFAPEQSPIEHGAVGVGVQSTVHGAVGVGVQVVLH